MAKTLLIVGNGFSSDLASSAGLSLDPSQPFAFNAPGPFSLSRSLLDDLPRVRALLQEREEGESDYDLIRRFVARAPGWLKQRIVSGARARLLQISLETHQEYAWEQSELRHFLALAYAYLDVATSDQHYDAWPWTQWLAKKGDDILAAVSFSYDVVLERALSQAGVSFHRIGVEGERDGLPVIRPRGSCDFDLAERIRYLKPEDRLGQLSFINDAPLRRVNAEERSLPRNEPQVLLPFDGGPHLRLSWVTGGFQAFERLAARAEECVIVGLSYQERDRAEIDRLLDGLTDQCAVTVVAPERSPEMLSRLQSEVPIFDELGIKRGVTRPAVASVVERDSGPPE